MQNNIILLKENNPIIAYYLQCRLEEDGFIIINIDTETDFTSLCECYKPKCVIWNEEAMEGGKYIESMVAMRASLGIPIFAIKNFEVKERANIANFLLYDKVLYKPFSHIQFKHFLAYLQESLPNSLLTCKK